MQTEKILATLIDNPGIGAKKLAELSGAKQNTVETVLQRHERAIRAERASNTGKKGRPEHRYAVLEDWIPVFQQRWGREAGEQGGSTLERALTTLEAASFAAVDPLESEADRRRMATVAALRVKAARALMTQAANEASLHEAEARITRAQARVAASTKAIPPPKRVRPAPAANDSLLRAWWAQWVGRLEALAEQYGAEKIGSGADRQGMAMVLDLIPGEDPLKASLLDALRAHHRPTLCVSVADLSAGRQATFLKRFEVLALDPIARHANLFVTVDSRQAKSKNAWAKIDEIAHRDRLPQAVKIANGALIEMIVEQSAPPAIVAPAKAYYDGFVERAIQQAEDEGSFWRSYGSPHVLDVETNDAFQAQAEHRSWSYLPRAAWADLNPVAAGDFELTW